VVVPTCDPSTQEAEDREFEFEDSLGYTKQNPVSKKKNPGVVFPGDIWGDCH
jgi:hypothetical protein